jgi:hypothetical protein
MARLSVVLVGLFLIVAAAACGGAGATSAPTIGASTAATMPPMPPGQASPTTPAAPTGTAGANATFSQAAYLQLLGSIPATVAQVCEPFKYTANLPAEPGEVAEADCDFPTGGPADFATYKLFADKASMDAFFDTQRKGHENAGTITGPGCGKGPGEGSWANGRKDCYLFITNDAQVDWTHETLFIFASAFRDDGDFAKLETFWATAGPAAP